MAGRYRPAFAMIALILTRHFRAAEACAKKRKGYLDSAHVRQRQIDDQDMWVRIVYGLKHIYIPKKRTTRISWVGR